MHMQIGVSLLFERDRRRACSFASQQTRPVFSLALALPLYTYWAAASEDQDYIEQTEGHKALGNEQRILRREETGLRWSPPLADDAGTWPEL